MSLLSKWLTGRSSVLLSSKGNAILKGLQDGVEAHDAATVGQSMTIAGTQTITGNKTFSGTVTIDGATTLNGAITLGDAAADALTVNATVTQGAPVNYSNETGISAGATQTLAGATALTEEVNNITTVATAGDGVKLPTAVAGLHIKVKNSGATALSIWPGNSSDAIDALGVNGTTFVRLQPGSSMDFYAKDATTWESALDNSVTLNAPTAAKGQLEFK